MDLDEMLVLVERFSSWDMLKHQDKELFESSSLEDLQRDINAIQSQQEITQTLMNLTRIEPFLTGMTHFEKALIAVGFQHTSKAMAYVWGPVRYLLKLFRELPESEACLKHIYEDVLMFHQLAYKLFSRTNKLWQKLRRATWKDWGHTFSYLANSLSYHGNFITSHGLFIRNQLVNLDNVGDLMRETSELATFQDWSSAKTSFHRYRSDRNGRRETFEENESSRKLEQKKNILGWISASKKTQGLHDKFRDMRICRDTGRWLFRRYSDVTNWMKEDPPPESAIWLHGSRGFERKKYVIPRNTKTYYFYCQEGDPELSTYLGLIKGILHQMVEDDDDLLAFCNDKMVTSGSTTLESIEAAQNLLEAYFEHNPRQYVIIDGLDECETVEICEMAKFFMDQVTKTENECLGRLRVLFVSQPMPELPKDMRMPEDDACIALKPRDNAEDIKAYVKARIPDFSEPRGTSRGFNLSDSDREQIEATICHRSEDMFLYAHLAIEYLLQQPTKERLLDKIKGEMLPLQLSQIYERVLGGIKNDLLTLPEGETHWEMAKLLLGWLVCAKRPLRWHEMQSILSYDPDNQLVDFDNKMLRHTVRKYLGSLVHVLPGGHIRLIHSTARRSSLSAISDDRLLTARLGWFSFQDYACSQWHSHIDTIIRMCRNLFEDPDLYWKYVPKLDFALQSFIDTHRGDLETAPHPDLDQTSEELPTFVGLPFYGNLRFLWNHIYCHQKREYDIRNTVGITQLDEALVRNRAALEKNFTPSAKTHLEDTIEDYYGPNLYKCKRTLCKFFYLGYDKEKDRDAHDKRHDRPYPCPKYCRLNPIGFSSRKDRDRHVRVHHPDLTEEPTVFEALSRRVDLAPFKCKICPKAFTRNINLKGHERSHFGDRPYACTTCGRAFARVNDCRRHEKIHARRGAL
ncbi:hypothetical protein GQ53DRAFT_723812 [Thozetella sp. PMI_491]|nr:hypothetical protein GQ53DRAFT_723812 [Thozetella sp. PMI_491]